MTPNLFRAIGQALYGPSWQSEMARRLDVALRTVQRWAAGTFPVPDSLRVELRVLIDKNVTDLCLLDSRIKQLPDSPNRAPEVSVSAK